MPENSAVAADHGECDRVVPSGQPMTSAADHACSKHPVGLMGVACSEQLSRKTMGACQKMSCLGGSPANMSSSNLPKEGHGPDQRE